MAALMSKSVFGDRMRVRRAALGLTLAELAERSGMHLQAIAKIEAGKRPNPTWETVLALSKALGVNPMYFDPDAEEPADQLPGPAEPEPASESPTSRRGGKKK